jgi:hypothetical protein
MAFNNLKGKKFTTITSSAGVKTQEIYRKTPAVLRVGKKNKDNGGFLNYNLILSASQQTLSSSFYDDNAVIVQVDTSSNEVGVFVTASVFQDNMNDFLENTAGFSSSSYQQISASFFQTIGNATNNMPFSEQYVGILASPFESGSIGSGSEIIKPVTASFKVLEAPGIAFAKDGTERSRSITYLNDSSFFTNAHHFFNFDEKNSDVDFGDAKQEQQTNNLVAANQSYLTRSFAAHTNRASSIEFYYVQPTPIRKFSLRMTSSYHTSSFYALTSSFSSSADFGVKSPINEAALKRDMLNLSGSFIGKIIESASIRPRFYNGTTPGGATPSGDSTDGKWLFASQKHITEGEGEFHDGEANYAGDTGTNVAFSPIKLLVWYPPEYTYNNVRSASFHYVPYPQNMQQLDVGAKTRDLVTGSISSSEALGTGELRTVYWLNHSFTSSFTGSFGNFNRNELAANSTRNAQMHQLPYMNTSIREFGKKGQFSNASHLWNDEALSVPADQGYYVHSASFTSQSKAQMAKLLGSENHTGSFFVYGSFVHPFIPFFDTAIMNYTASQEGMAAVNADTTLSHHPILSCIFLKTFDDQVFIYQPKDGQAVISESVG